MLEVVIQKLCPNHAVLDHLFTTQELDSAIRGGVTMLLCSKFGCKAKSLVCCLCLSDKLKAMQQVASASTLTRDRGQHSKMLQDCTDSTQLCL